MTAEAVGRQHTAKPPYFIDALELPAALDALSAHGSDLTILAGGTDVMVQYLRGDIHPIGLLHIRRLRELKGCSFGPRTRIGALTTHWQLMTEDSVKRAHPALAEAAATVGGRQTQNAGTIAGNLVNASPAADLIPVLLVSDATVTLQSASGTRDVVVRDFLLGRRSTARQVDELVTGLSLEAVGPGTGETYLKLGRRAAMEVAIVGLAVRLSLGPDETVQDLRVALASVGPRAVRADEVEARLLGSKMDAEDVAEAGRLLRDSARPIDDSRATAAYRDRVLPGLLGAALDVCRSRALERRPPANGS